MNCQETQSLIHAYADGELDLVKTLDIERHMQSCTECAAAHRGVLALRASIGDGSLYHRAPAALEQRIRTQIRRERAGAGGHRFIGRKWLAAAAAMVAISAILSVVIRSSGNGANEQLAAEITSAHIRSLMAEHLWDVKSSDRHTVKPWFDGKIDFAPEVRDFRSEGFALEGGRLDYVASRAVAALVYRHEKHEINLFIWPAPGRADEAETVKTRQGYVLVHWVQSGMNYWAVSDTSEAQLRRLAQLTHDRGAATRASSSAAN